MGTNYYHHRDCCPHCDRPGEIVHIGKASGGWTFSFHATEELRSWKQWRERLAEPGGKIVDECGEDVTLEEFIELVESKKGERSNHARRYMNDYLSGQRCFVDDEGNSFSEGVFS